MINLPIYSKDFSSLNSKGVPTNSDSLIYYIFSCEFIFLLIKLIAKFLKLITDLTQINLQKHWNHKLLVFNIISFIRYAIKLIIEIVNIIFILEILYCSSKCWSCPNFLHNRCFLFLLESN